MRRSAAVVLAVITALLSSSPAHAKGDFFEFTVTGRGLIVPVRFETVTQGLMREVTPPRAAGAAPYVVRVAVGFFSNPHRIEMEPWDYFPAGRGRPPLVLVRYRNGYGVTTEWWELDPRLAFRIDAEVAAARGGRPIEEASSPPEHRAPSELLGILAVGSLLVAVVLLARRGGFTRARARDRGALA